MLIFEGKLREDMIAFFKYLVLALLLLPVPVDVDKQGDPSFAESFRSLVSPSSYLTST